MRLMARLVLMHEGVGIRSFPVEKEETSIGRHADSDIRLDDQAVSSRHARLVLTADPYLEGHSTVVLEDLDSTNGTQLNGGKVRKAPLRHGDQIRIGRYEFSFVQDDGHSLDRTTILLADKPS